MNKVIDTMMRHFSVRKYEDRMPSDSEIETIVRAGQQAPFAAQLYSVIMCRKKKHPFGAPLLFTICADFHKMNLIMERRGWSPVSNDMSILIMGFQDASYMAENMIIAGESMGIGSCLLGAAPYMAERIKAEYELPDKVFPMVQLVMGYTAEERPVRPRYPLDFVLFEDKYPQFSDEAIKDAMEAMDKGYLAQDYYRLANAKIKITTGKEDSYTYDDYSWTEHISRKWGQRNPSLAETFAKFKACGFDLSGEDH
jgi:nitroreductase